MRTYDDIINEIREMAPYYAPEWRFNSDNPDAGSALAFIWARMLSGTAQRLDAAADAAALKLLNALGAERADGAHARGFLCFTPQPGLEGTLTVPAGTQVSVPEEPDTALVTECDITVSGAALSAIYEASREPDCAHRLDGIENLSLFCFFEKNERSWVFEHSKAFDVSPGGAVLLKMDFTQGGDEYIRRLASPKCAIWEYLSREGWARIPELAQYGGSIIMRGMEEPLGGAVRLRITDSRAFETADFCRLRIFPQNEKLPPTAVYRLDLPLTDAGFFPFGESFMPYDAVNIACDEAFAKPGALIELSFTVRMINNPITWYPRPEQDWRPVMRPEEIIRIEEKEISINSVSWEYFNGTGWAALEVGSDARRAFKAKGEPEPRVVSFVCPKDMEAVPIGAHETRFIRARILSLKNAFAMYGSYLSPWIEQLSFSYGCDDGYEPERIIGTQNMSSREYPAIRESVRLIDMQFGHPAVYFEFTEPFAEGTLLWEMEDLDTDLPSLSFEYYADSRWRALDTQPQTQSFRKTWLMSYLARERPEKLRLFGRESYWMRAVDISGELAKSEVKPRLRRVWENAVPVIAAAPGVSSNRDRESYTAPMGTIKGIAAVKNPLPITGGRDAESEEAARSRSAKTFSHGCRAISCRDIEHLAMEASRDIIKCKCAPDTDRRVLSRGGLCLALLTAKLSTSEFESLSDCVRAYIERLLPLGAQVPRIITPRFVTLSLRAVVRTGRVRITETEIIERVDGFLNPETGYFDGGGWDFGALPTPEQINGALRRLEGIEHIVSAHVTYMLGKKREVVPYRSLCKEPFILPRGGEHEVIIESDA